MFRFVNCISLLLHILEVCYAPFSLCLQKFEFERYQKIFLCSNFYQFWQLSHIFVPNHQKRATNSVNCFGGNRHKTVSSHPTELTRKKKLTNLLNKGKSIIEYRHTIKLNSNKRWGVYPANILFSSHSLQCTFSLLSWPLSQEDFWLRHRCIPLEELHLREERNNWISGPTCCIHSSKFQGFLL